MLWQAVLLGVLCCSYLPTYVRNLKSFLFATLQFVFIDRLVDWCNDALPESCAGRDCATASRKQGAAEFVRVLKHALTEYRKVHPEIPQDRFAVVDELVTGTLPIIGRGRSNVVAPGVLRVQAYGAPAMEMER